MISMDQSNSITVDSSTNNYHTNKVKGDGSWCHKAIYIPAILCEIMSWLDMISFLGFKRINKEWLHASEQPNGQQGLHFESEKLREWDGGKRVFISKLPNILGLKYAQSASIHTWEFQLNRFWDGLGQFERIQSLILKPYSKKQPTTYNNEFQYEQTILDLLQKNSKHIEKLVIGSSMFDTITNTNKSTSTNTSANTSTKAETETKNSHIHFPVLQKLTMTKKQNYIRFGDRLEHLEMQDLSIDYSLWQHLSTCKLNRLKALLLDSISSGKIPTGKKDETEELIATIAEKLTNLSNFKWTSSKSCFGLKSLFISCISKCCKNLESIEFNITNNKEFANNYEYSFESINEAWITISTVSNLTQKQLSQISKLLTQTSPTTTNTTALDYFSVDHSPTNMRFTKNAICGSLALDAKKKNNTLPSCLNFNKILKLLNDKQINTSKLEVLQITTSVKNEKELFQVLKQIESVKNIANIEIDALFHMDVSCLNWSQESMKQLGDTMQRIFDKADDIKNIDLACQFPYVAFNNSRYWDVIALVKGVITGEILEENKEGIRKITSKEKLKHVAFFVRTQTVGFSKTCHRVRIMKREYVENVYKNHNNQVM